MSATINMPEPSTMSPRALYAAQKKVERAFQEQSKLDDAQFSTLEDYARTLEHEIETRAKPAIAAQLKAAPRPKTTSAPIPTAPAPQTVKYDTINPTAGQYGTLQGAYTFFNERLFAGTLPPCLITLQRQKKSRGYFHAEKFRAAGSNAAIHEIAMNPCAVEGRKTEDILSTLAHEMAHLWQQEHGKPGRGSYHNKEWGTKMKEIGLYPSSTGEAGGKETGQKVSHYIIPEGRFALAADSFLKEHGAIFYQYIADGGNAKKTPSKTKYTCPDCETNAWAKPDTHLNCGTCNIPMEAI